MKAFKCTLSLLIALLLMMSMTSAVFAADEDGDMSAYVLHYGVADNGYDGPNLQYFSPYVTNYTFQGTPSYIQSNIFSLYNTVTGEVIPAYCTDISVGALAGNRYRRQNLEDSTYAAGAADQLRAIVQNGFYLIPISGETLDEHAVRVDAKLAELGAAAGVEDLTIGEAISGTQTAIWQAAHGTDLEFTDFVRTIYTTKMPSAAKYYELCNEERDNGHIDYTVSSYGQVTLAPESDAYLCARIQAVYDYLLALDPVEATDQTVSPTSFVQLAAPTLSANTDGTYNVSVTTTVDVDMAAGDALTLTASLADTYTSSVALGDGKQRVTLAINNVPADVATGDVDLIIEGTQTVSDVFLFDAYGDRDTAQSMIGMDDSRLPVYASVRAVNDMTLNIQKVTRIATGTDTYEDYPLEGIAFDVYLAATMDDYLTGTVKLPEPEDFVRPEYADYVAITDENGEAVVNFSQLGLPQGVYLVVERTHPAIEAPVDPFYVSIPTTNEDGTGYEYNVTVKPKNDVKGGVDIEKDVISLGNDEATVDAYTNHTWIVGATIPEDIAIGKSYVISDLLDPRLDYIGNLKVNVETKDGATVVTTLSADTDYTLTVSDVDSLSDGAPSDAFTVELTAAGMGTIAAAVGENSVDDYMLRVYFDTQINGNAEMGEEIPNQATLKYTNSVNFDFDDVSDKPVVYTGGANLLKVDEADHSKTLPGAVFEVYRKATAEEVAAGGDAITHINGVSAAVVKVPFFDNAAMEGEKVTSATSDENGKVAIYGLAYGDYYILETAAPAGYNLPESAVKLPIDGTTHTQERVITIENTAGSAPVLPSTGGIGTTVFTVSGLLLLCVSVVILITKRRVTCGYTD